MFLELDKKDQNKIAIIDSEGNQCSYGQILLPSISISNIIDIIKEH